MAVLVTGAAGFIGFHTSRRLMSQGRDVIGLDNLNDYYDPQLKRDRLGILKKENSFSFSEGALEDTDGMKKLFEERSIDSIVHLAAQAGVRYSMENPMAYIQSNLVGFGNILEGARAQKVKHLVYASSSSVYGLNHHMPFCESHSTDHPMSLYAATKKSNEMMAHSYSHLYDIPTTGLRFFTVYGPWGRPDMALFLFTKAILEGKPINIFNHGDMRRDFTYIDDIVEGIVRVLERPASSSAGWNPSAPLPNESSAPFALYNIGNHFPVQLTDFIDAIEKKLDRQAIRNLMPMQPGDVPETSADIQNLFNAVGFSPNTSIEQGIDAFVDWYLDYYKA